MSALSPPQRTQVYDAFLKNSIRRAVAQTRQHLDELRPCCVPAQYMDLPKRLFLINGLFSKIDKTLLEIEQYKEARNSPQVKP